MTICDVVIPTFGRPSLGAALSSLAPERERLGGRVLIVDDRPGGPPLTAPVWAEVIAGRARGPAAARNDGARAATAEWVAFLDDDVQVTPGWADALAADISAAGDRVAGIQGRIRVPLPSGRRPTDWERNVAGLERARWATADMAFRLAALEGAGGFDERFRRAYREDADLALRLLARGWELERGRRLALHPVPAAPAWVSVRLQAGNRDDVLMRRIHGRAWRRHAGAPRGRLRRHVAVTGAGLAALAAAALGRRRIATAAAAVWAAGTAELAWARIGPGPRTASEVTKMLTTSLAIPVVASVRAAEGELRHPHGLRPHGRPRRPEAILFDRDGTLVEDVPYNGEPGRVRPVPAASAALARLRAAGVPTAVVTNQSGIAAGTLTEAQVAGVNRRVDELLGPLGPWLVCPHGPEDGCGCRKPAPGLIVAAARALGVDPSACAVIGDTAADVGAARAAGARGVLVPNAVTRRDEVRRAAEVAADLEAAVSMLLEDVP
ncbi:MAG TPA: HAD-IIIA family hydrolase [Gaiellales bacterium]|nr:HAD-IIIA family hydrolase [Gaiellales bacterium]